MIIRLLNEAGDLACYTTDNGVLYGPYPPTAGQIAFAYEEAGGGSIQVEPYAAPSVIPTTISDRQFFQQLAIDGVITQDEALATADGTMPALLVGIINAMPEAARFGALMLVKNATTFERYHQLTAVVGQSLGWDGQRLDRLWLEASKL